MRKGRDGKKKRNNCIWILTRYDSPDFGQIGRPDRIRAKRKGSGALWKLED